MPTIGSHRKIIAGLFQIEDQLPHVHKWNTIILTQLLHRLGHRIRMPLIPNPHAGDKLHTRIVSLKPTDRPFIGGNFIRPINMLIVTMSEDHKVRPRIFRIRIKPGKPFMPRPVWVQLQPCLPGRMSIVIRIRRKIQFCVCFETAMRFADRRSIAGHHVQQHPVDRIMKLPQQFPPQSSRTHEIVL